MRLRTSQWPDGGTRWPWLRNDRPGHNGVLFDVEEYRAAVRALGMTDAVADWWPALNRPAVIFGPRLDGPLGGQLGGAPLLRSIWSGRRQ